MASPLFPFIVAFCIGTLLSHWTQTPNPSLLLAGTGLLFCSWLLFLLQANPTIFTIAALTTFTSLGLSWASIYDCSFGPHHLRTLIRTGQLDLTQPCRVKGICTRSEIQNQIGEQFDLDISSLENRRFIYLTSGRVRLALFYKTETTKPDQNSGTTRDALPAFSMEHASSALINPGDLIEVLVSLKKARNFNDPGQFDYVSYLERQEIYLVGTVKSELLITKIASNQGPWHQRTVQRIRMYLLAELDKWPSSFEEGTGALKALLLGTKQGLSPQLEEDFQATGIYHVLVVSGQHVAIIAAVFLGILRLFSLPPLFSLTVTGSGLIFYCLLTESQPSIVRATLMTLFFLLTLHSDRDRNLLNSLSLSGLALLIIDPLWLYDPGFQLSYLAVLAIALVGVPLVRLITQPYRQALHNLQEPSFDAYFPPRLADLRISLRLNLDKWNQTRIRRSLKLGKVVVLWPILILLYLTDILLISAGVQALFIVLMILYFHRVSLVSVVLNILVIPLVGVIVPLGFLSLILAISIPALSRYFIIGCQFLTGLLLNLARHFADPMWGNIRVATPPTWVVLVYLGSLALLVWRLFAGNPAVIIPFSPHRSVALQLGTPKEKSGFGRRGLNYRWILVFFFAALIGLFLLVFQPFPPRGLLGRLEMTILDVHLGDSVFLQFPDNATMLIDGGGLPAQGFGGGFSDERFDIGERVVSPFLWSKGIKKIHTVVLTHAHHDHLSGLNSVIKNFKVDQLWIGKNPPTAEYLNFMKNAIMAGIQIRSFRAGCETPFHGATISFINPEKGQFVGTMPSNNDSLAFRLRYMRRSFLLTGDLERKIEYRLLDQSYPLDSDVLKVAHHGSRSSTTPEFLAKVNPAMAVISTAQSDFLGHPHIEVLKRLDERHVQIYRTDLNGAIVISTGGRDLQVNCFLD